MGRTGGGQHVAWAATKSLANISLLMVCHVAKIAPFSKVGAR